MTDFRRAQVAIGCYAMAAGYADCASFLSVKVFTGHVTGNLILLLVAASQKSWGVAANHLLSISCFMAFTALGFFVANWPYNRAWLFSLQAALLSGILFHPGPSIKPFWLVALFSSSLGLQNGTVTSVFGVSLHSTFLSGDVTSLLHRLTIRPKRSLADLRSPSGEEQKGGLLFAWTTGSFAAGALLAALTAHLAIRQVTATLLVLLFAAMIPQL